LSRQLKSDALVDELAKKLEAAIFRGEYPPGTRVREARLAKTLGVARGSMREAVRRLEGRKLLVRRRNLGTWVAIPTKEELQDLLELREGLEVTACRLAAEKITNDELAKLEAILLRHKELTPDNLSELYEEWRNLDFHYQLALASGNRRLIDLLCGDILCLLRLYRYPGVLSPGRVSVGGSGHQAIFEALAAHDPDACERAMRRHLGSVRERLLHQSLGKREPQRRKKQKSASRKVKPRSSQK
jgi:DNA-binding GntR family transcriptional regulator